MGGLRVSGRRRQARTVVGAVAVAVVAAAACSPAAQQAGPAAPADPRPAWGRSGLFSCDEAASFYEVLDRDRTKVWTVAGPHVYSSLRRSTTRSPVRHSTNRYGPTPTGARPSTSRRTGCR